MIYLDTAFPSCSIQILIDNSVPNPWTCTSTAMMLERGYNAMYVVTKNKYKL